MAGLKSGPPDGNAHRALHRAACDYAHLAGWRVLPGAVWDGNCYHRGLSTARTTELEPLRPLGRATADFKRVYHWWKVAPFAILAPTGEAFDVPVAPAALALAALEALPPVPAFLGPHGAGLLVAPGADLRPELAAAGVALIGAGGVTALPPTVLRRGALTWHVDPVDVGWRPGDAEAVQRALYAAISPSAKRDR